MKACRHLGSISLGKLTQKLTEISSVGTKSCNLCKTTSASVENYACLTCLEPFCPPSHINNHARDRNHPLSISLKLTNNVPEDSVESRFYCSICGDSPRLSVPGKKERIILEKVLKAFIENQSNLPLSMDSIKADLETLNESSANSLLSSKIPLLVPKGILNLGNTCFMNSALQLLAATLIRTSSEKPVDNSVALWNSLIHYLSEIYSSNPSSKKRSASQQPVNPREFLSLLSGKQKKFASLQQQDAHDFLRLLFNSCAVAAKTDDQPRMFQHQEWFGGKFVSRVICGRCRKVSDTTEPFLDISLCLDSFLEDTSDGSIESAMEKKLFISGDLNVVDLLKLWNKKIPLEGENGYYCENCSPQDSSVLQEASLQFHLLPTSMPQFLILHLQRFRTSFLQKSSSKKGKKKKKSSSSSSTINVEIEKDDRSIRFPETFQIPQECFLELEKDPPGYALYGYIIHEGSSIDYGHYTAVVASTNREHWYYISDTQVKEISKSRALDPEFYNPYLIFYERTRSVD